MPFHVPETSKEENNENRPAESSRRDAKNRSVVHIPFSQAHELFDLDLKPNEQVLCGGVFVPNLAQMVQGSDKSDRTDQASSSASTQPINSNSCIRAPEFQPRNQQDSISGSVRIGGIDGAARAGSDLYERDLSASQASSSEKSSENFEEYEEFPSDFWKNAPSPKSKWDHVEEESAKSPLLSPKVVENRSADLDTNDAPVLMFKRNETEEPEVKLICKQLQETVLENVTSDDFEDFEEEPLGPMAKVIDYLEKLPENKQSCMDYAKLLTWANDRRCKGNVTSYLNMVKTLCNVMKPHHAQNSDSTSQEKLARIEETLAEIAVLEGFLNEK